MHKDEKKHPHEHGRPAEPVKQPPGKVKTDDDPNQDLGGDGDNDEDDGGTGADTPGQRPGNP